MDTTSDSVASGTAVTERKLASSGEPMARYMDQFAWAVELANQATLEPNEQKRKAAVLSIIERVLNRVSAKVGVALGIDWHTDYSPAILADIAAIKTAGQNGGDRKVLATAEAAARPTPATSDEFAFLCKLCKVKIARIRSATYDENGRMVPRPYKRKRIVPVAASSSVSTN